MDQSAAGVVAALQINGGWSLFTLPNTDLKDRLVATSDTFTTRPSAKSLPANPYIYIHIHTHILIPLKDLLVFARTVG